MGKELRRIGAPFRQPEWSALALLESPEHVGEAHRNFIDAGASVIITNTYSVVPYHIGSDRFDDRGAELVALAAGIARAEADAAEGAVQVAGSIPPLFGSYEPDKFDPEAAPALWQVLIENQERFVDLWVGETLSSIEECRALIAALTRFSTGDKPVWLAFTLDDELHDGRALLRSGEPLSAVVDLVTELAETHEIDAVLFNCSQPESITPALQEMHSSLGSGSSVRLGAYANAFPAETIDDEGYASNERIIERREDLTPSRYAELVGQWIDDGAVIVGGCCDIYATHIAELSQRFGPADRQR